MPTVTPTIPPTIAPTATPTIPPVVIPTTVPTAIPTMTPAPTEALKPTPTLAEPVASFTQYSVRMQKGEKHPFTIRFEQGNPEDITWMTTKKEVAVVAKNRGKLTAMVTAKTIDTDVIVVKAGNQVIAKIKVSVIEPEKRENQTPVVHFIKWIGYTK